MLLKRTALQGEQMPLGAQVQGVGGALGKCKLDHDLLLFLSTLVVTKREEHESKLSTTFLCSHVSEYNNKK